MLSVKFGQVYSTHCFFFATSLLIYIYIYYSFSSTTIIYIRKKWLVFQRGSFGKLEFGLSFVSIVPLFFSPTLFISKVLCIKLKSNPNPHGKEH